MLGCIFWFVCSLAHSLARSVCITIFCARYLFLYLIDHVCLCTNDLFVWCFSIIMKMLYRYICVALFGYHSSTREKKYKSMFKENENVFWMLAIFQMEWNWSLKSFHSPHHLLYNAVSEVIVWTLFLMIYNWKHCLSCYQSYQNSGLISLNYYWI